MFVSRENFGQKIGLSMYQNVNKSLGVGVSVDQSGDKLNLSLGGAFVPEKGTSLRGTVRNQSRVPMTAHSAISDDYDGAQVDSEGVISALYTQSLCPSVRSPSQATPCAHDELFHKAVVCSNLRGKQSLKYCTFNLRRLVSSRVPIMRRWLRPTSVTHAQQEPHRLTRVVEGSSRARGSATASGDGAADGE